MNSPFTGIEENKEYSTMKQYNWGALGALAFCLIFWALVIWGLIELL